MTRRNLRNETKRRRPRRRLGQPRVGMTGHQRKVLKYGVGHSHGPSLMAIEAARLNGRPPPEATWW